MLQGSIFNSKLYFIVVYFGATRVRRERVTRLFFKSFTLHNSTYGTITEKAFVWILYPAWKAHAQTVMKMRHGSVRAVANGCALGPALLLPDIFAPVRCINLNDYAIIV